jgi:ethanolamine utilization protein EutN
MILGRVVGQVVSTHKRPQFEGATLLLVQPETPSGAAVGATLLAVDSVGAGVSERVLVVLEGRAAGEALRRKGAPVDAAIIGIVDAVDLTE